MQKPMEKPLHPNLERLLRRDPSRVLAFGIKLLRMASMTALGALLGQAPLLFGTAPLGVALLCAAGKDLLPIALGLVLSAVFSSEWQLLKLGVVITLTALRLLTAFLFAGEEPELPRELCEILFPKTDGKRVNRRLAGWIRILKRETQGLFREQMLLRMASAALGMLVLSLVPLIVGGFRVYDLFALLFSVAVAPIATWIYAVSTEASRDAKILPALSLGALLVSLVYAASPLSLVPFPGLYIPLAPLIALTVTLYCTAERKEWIGLVAAVFCGLVYDPLQIPALLFASLVLGFLTAAGKRRVGVTVACLSALLWSVSMSSVEHAVGLLPSYLLAGIAYELARVVFPQGEAVQEAPLEDSEARLHCAKRRQEDGNDRLRSISDAFSSLSELFYNLSDRLKRPGTIDLRRICDEAFDTSCPDCPSKTVCWGLEYEQTLSTLNRLTSRLHTRGKVDNAQIPEHLLCRCPSMDRILSEMNRGCAKLTVELLRNNRTEIIAMDYEAAASIINDALEEDDGEYRFDPELASRISTYLSDAGITAAGVTVYGKRRLQILARGVFLDGATVTAQTMQSDLGEMCGLALTPPSFEIEGGSTTMTLQAKRCIGVQGAQNNLSADGNVSGDTVNLFSNRKDYFYALISDGMGSGGQAALTSGLCSSFLEKMLRAGNRAGTSLRMLNNTILSRTESSAEECSSTIDLLELDLITGEADFIKGGAAPSFIIRDGTVQKIFAGSAPIGIIKKLDTRTTHYPLRIGDTVVMISDGILQYDPECEQLISLLSELSEADPEEIVYKICFSASEHPVHDDCSAVALRITDEKE